MNQQPPKEIILSLSKKKGDFIVSTSRSSGPGGQNVNKRDTKVRIVHPASGATGESQTHKQQEKNRRAAFRRLVETQTFKLWLKTELAKLGHEGATRPHEGPTGSRGERVRTYNMVRDEVIDHRTGIHVANAGKVLDGNLDPIISSLQEERARCLVRDGHNSER